MCVVSEAGSRGMGHVCTFLRAPRRVWTVDRDRAAQRRASQSRIQRTTDGYHVAMATSPSILTGHADADLSGHA